MTIIYNVEWPSSVEVPRLWTVSSAIFPNSAYKGYILQGVIFMDIAQGQCLPCDLCDFSSLPACQNKPLHHSAKDLNHLSSSCYLDNCQQEQACPFSRQHAEAPSCSLLTILHTWSQREGVRMPIIFTVCCAGYSGEAECCWLPWQKLTAPWTWDPCKSTQQSVFFVRQQGVPVAMNQVMEHNTVHELEHEHRQRQSFSLSLNR